MKLKAFQSYVHNVFGTIRVKSTNLNHVAQSTNEKNDT